jgi:hypothetical protein
VTARPTKVDLREGAPTNGAKMTDPLNPLDPDATELEGEYTDTDFGDDDDLAGDSDLAPGTEDGEYSDADLAGNAARPGADTGLGTDLEGEYTDTDFTGDRGLTDDE